MIWIWGCDIYETEYQTNLMSLLVIILQMYMKHISWNFWVLHILFKFSSTSLLGVQWCRSSFMTACLGLYFLCRYLYSFSTFIIVKSRWSDSNGCCNSEVGAANTSHWFIV